MRQVAHAKKIKNFTYFPGGEQNLKALARQRDTSRITALMSKTEREQRDDFGQVSDTEAHARCH